MTVQPTSVDQGIEPLDTLYVDRDDDRILICAPPLGTILLTRHGAETMALRLLFEAQLPLKDDAARL